MGIQHYKTLKYMAYVDIAACAFGAVIFFSNMLGYNFVPDELISLEDIDFFAAFGLAATCIGLIPIFTGSTEGLSDDDVSKIDSKMKIYKLLNVPLIAYVVVCGLLVRDKYLFISACIMETAYFASTLFSRKMYELIITDSQLKWEKMMHGDGTNEDDMEYSNILWRLKVWVSPAEYIPMNCRYINKANLATAVIILLFIYGGSSIKMSNPIFWVPVGIIASIEIISILEYFLGLYTSITGLCTAVEELREGTGDTSYNRHYCRVYVTDFEHKRELVFETYDYMVMYKDQNIKVIHSMFTKNPVMVNDMKIKYRSII